MSGIIEKLGLAPDKFIEGISPGTQHQIIRVEEYYGDKLRFVLKDENGKITDKLLSLEETSRLRVVNTTDWTTLASGEDYKLSAEALRIRLAHLFDPYIALHCSQLDPLPHQIAAVYQIMLERHPLKFLLADDPGAGKTIMCGLLIKELIVRGDLKRCLIVVPGSLAEQWKDELLERFQLRFKIFNGEPSSESEGNWFDEENLVIARLDKLSRNAEVQEKLCQVDWDLAVFDEAHKLSATRFGSEVRKTKRYQLGKLVADRSRQLLLMSATPHNGKPDDFHLFLSLLDEDRFEGEQKNHEDHPDPSDLMRRMVKEQLLKFDGKPLFPERIAHTIGYGLSDNESKLYESVTSYVKEEFDRADKLEDTRKGTVGFALTSLQRRLASSPAAILQSLLRRRKRLMDRLLAEEFKQDGSSLLPGLAARFDAEAMEDVEDASDTAAEEEEEWLVENASAASNIIELKLEIQTLNELVKHAEDVYASRKDRKWEELSGLLIADEMKRSDGTRHKLVIFTEFVDTLTYLTDRLRTQLGRDNAVVEIHGKLNRSQRREAQDYFTQDPQAEILIATDAAGEGINLQCAHLMINYDLPWNPNRLEQRFGRIHRIGQREVCHLWNLLASDTREGAVFLQLLTKLDTAREALKGAVFDVLGQVVQQAKLREMLIEAIRYGEDPETKKHLSSQLAHVLDHANLEELMQKRALFSNQFSSSKVQEIREQMDRAQVQRLQPHYIEAFFMEAFRSLGGNCLEREWRRFEVRQIPERVRLRARERAGRGVLSENIARITFEQSHIYVDGGDKAEFVAPGHPLLESVVDLIREDKSSAMRQGALLVNPLDDSEQVRILYCMQQDIEDGIKLKDGNDRLISRQLQFIWQHDDGTFSNAGPAPYLDFLPPTPAQLELLVPKLDSSWVASASSQQATAYAVESMLPQHEAEIKRKRFEQISKIESEVKRRLTSEIRYWDQRSNDLLEETRSGKQPKMNYEQAMKRREDFISRRNQRLAELKLERDIRPRTPELQSRAIVVSAGLLRKLGDHSFDALAKETQWSSDPLARAKIERLAMEAVLKHEISLGFQPRDVSAENRGYDIESRDPSGGPLRFIEVKGRVAGAETVTVTRNELLCGYNCPEQWFLALVEVADGMPTTPRYHQGISTEPPNWAMTSMVLDLARLDKGLAV